LRFQDLTPIALLRLKTLNAVVRIEAVTGISTDVGRDIYVAAGANIWKLSEPR